PASPVGAPLFDPHASAPPSKGPAGRPSPSFAGDFAIPRTGEGSHPGKGAAAAVHASPAPPIADPEVERRRDAEAIAKILFAAARSDGRLAKSEAAAARAALLRRLGEGAAERNFAESLCQHYSVAEIDWPEAARWLQHRRPAPELRELYGDVRAVLAISSGMNVKEMAFLEKLAAMWKIDISALAALSLSSNPEPRPAAPAPSPAATPVDPRQAWIKALEISADAKLGPDLVRRQFRLLCERLDPAKAKTFGPEIEKAVAAQRAAVEAAARGLLAEWLLPLEEQPAPPPSTDLRHNPDLDAIFGA
ncbi:MAG TPA: hypothetical protein VNC50_10055, partial [Planctomycetia bacterium]|nr:hypothetical protein [Planctomycetia bacterium]